MMPTTKYVLLALALLTDSKGVIDMEIPVGGNVDDPQFNVGSVVIGALVNLITKAITSPFTLLASLVERRGPAEAQFQVRVGRPAAVHKSKTG